MYEGLFQDETEQALEFRATNPRPPEPPRASVWSQAAEILKAVPKGVGQAAMQTTRNVQRVPVAGNPLAMSASEQEELLQDNGVTPEAVDRDLRRGIEALKPDPVSATIASRVLQDGARVLSKVGLYGAFGGGAGAVVGTGLDEGLTGRRELMDQGVDASTATKAGAVRGAAMAAGVALPVVGGTALKTAGLVALGGPGLFVAEQVTTRAILDAAEYPHLAQQYDPTDPVGLGLSVLVPGAVGAAVHRARARGAATAGAPEPAAVATPEPVPTATTTAPLPELLRSMPELQDAALVAHRSHVVDARLLADPADLSARQSHAAAMEAAAKAMDEGTPVSIAAVELDPVRASQAATEMQARIRAAEAELAPLRAAEDAQAPVDTVQALDPAVPYRAPVGDGGFDVTTLLTDAQRLLDINGRGASAVMDNLRAAGQTISPEMHNALAGLQEFPGRLQDIAQQFRAAEVAGTGRAPGDVLAEAIDRMRKGEIPAAQATPLGRADQIARQQPTMPVRMDEADGPRTASDVVDEARADARQDRTDAKAFAAAVECMLRTGS